MRPFNSLRVLLQPSVTPMTMSPTSHSFQFSSSLIATGSRLRRRNRVHNFQFSSSLIATKARTMGKYNQLAFQFSSSLIATSKVLRTLSRWFSLSILFESYCNSTADDITDILRPPFNSLRVLLQPGYFIPSVPQPFPFNSLRVLLQPT